MERNVDPTVPAVPMVQRRRLRDGLRRARTQAGLTQRQVAHELGWSPSKLLRVENGQVGVSRTDLKALLQHYQVTDPSVVSAFVDMAAQGRRQSWGPYRDVLHPEFLLYLGYEGAASTLRQYQNQCIPGLLQTESYARELITAMAGPDTTHEQIQRQLDARMIRQDVLRRSDPLSAHFILGEAAIRLWVGAEAGAPQIMHDQLAYLKDVARLPHITIQVLPLHCGVYRGMQAPFVLLGFPDPDDTDLLFLENGAGSIASRDDTTKIDEFTETFQRLVEIATNPHQFDDFLDHISASVR